MSGLESAEREDFDDGEVGRVGTVSLSVPGCQFSVVGSPALAGLFYFSDSVDFSTESQNEI